MDYGFTHTTFSGSMAQPLILKNMFLNITSNTVSGNITNGSAIAQWDISDWNRDIFRRNMIPAFVYIWTLLLIGIPGNALVCYVYHFKIRNKQLSSNIFILALSWFDLVNCVLTLPFELTVIFHYVNFDQPVLCRLARFITFFCNNSTSVILLAIAIDRLRVFLSGPRRLQLKAFTSRTIVVVAMLISALISWPMLVFYGTLRQPISNGVMTKKCTISNDFLVSNHAINMVKAFTITLLIVHSLFDLSFIVIYSVIGKRICYDMDVTRRMSESSDHANSLRINRKGSDTSSEDDVFLTTANIGQKSPKRERVLKSSSFKEMNSVSTLTNCANSRQLLVESRPRSKSEPLRLSLLKRTDTLRSSIKSQFKDKMKSRCSSTNSEWRIYDHRPKVSKTSLMLFLVTIAYMITYLPYCILVSLRTINQSMYEELTDIEKSVYQVFFRSYCLGSAINPLIYSFINSSFRKKCREALNDIFCCKRKRSFKR